MHLPRYTAGVRPEDDAVYFYAPKGEEESKMQKKNYQQEILDLIHSGLPQAELAEKLSDYHENDLADALEALTPDERQ